MINELSKYWLSKGVWFGDIIHQVKPKTIDEWTQYLISRKWYFVKGMTYKKYERSYWIYYLKHSFYKLYESESIAIDYFKSNFNLDLKFTTHDLDVKYGYDFWFKVDNKTYYLIVKHGLYKSFDLAKLPDNVLVFDSANRTLVCNPPQPSPK